MVEAHRTNSARIIHGHSPSRKNGRKPTPEYTSWYGMKSRCRWATPMEQSQNLSNQKTLTFIGETMSVAAWSRKLGIHVDTLRVRLRRGWTVERILTCRPQPRAKRQ